MRSTRSKCSALASTKYQPFDIKSFLHYLQVLNHLCIPIDLPTTWIFRLYQDLNFYIKINVNRNTRNGCVYPILWYSILMFILAYNLVIQLDFWLPLHYETSLVPKTWLKFCLKEKLLVKWCKTHWTKQLILGV